MEIPQSLQPTWDVIYWEVIGVRGRWQMYQELYGRNQKRVDLLNECARRFFDMLRRVLFDDVQLTIANLGDNDRHTANLVLLFRKLEKLNQPSGFMNEVERHLNEFCSLSRKTIKSRRDNQIAHFNEAAMAAAHQHALGLAANPLPSPTPGEIDVVLTSLQSYMTTIEQHFTGKVAGEKSKSTLESSMIDLYLMQTGAEGLISVLKDGLYYRELILSDVIDGDLLLKIERRQS